MNEAVTLVIENGIADLRLNRPDKMNAVDGNIMAGLREAVAIIEACKNVRVVVLSGNGKAFCSGLDFSNFGDMLSGDLTADSVADAYDELSPAGANQQGPKGLLPAAAGILLHPTGKLFKGIQLVG